MVTARRPHDAPPPAAPAAAYQPRNVVTSAAELRALMGEPSERAVKKALPALDAYARAFIARSPFVLLGTCAADGTCDVSPKGDPPGFVLVLDDHTLVIPDRPGNRRVDSLLNVLENPHVGLLFLIPGMDETLRVNGQAHIVRDPDLLARLAVDGKAPHLALVVRVAQSFLHCGRSFLRAGLWNPERFMPRGELPTLAQMIQDQIRPPGRTEEEHRRLIAEALEREAHTYSSLY